jgi:hypothetical protein
LSAPSRFLSSMRCKVRAIPLSQSCASATPREVNPARGGRVGAQRGCGGGLRTCKVLNLVRSECHAVRCATCRVPCGAVCGVQDRVRRWALVQEVLRQRVLRRKRAAVGIAAAGLASHGAQTSGELESNRWVQEHSDERVRAMPARAWRALSAACLAGDAS